MSEDLPANQAYSSFGRLLEDLRGLLPTALIDDSGWERVQAVATRLPACTTDARFGFEFNLCEATPAADFCIVVPPGSRLAAFCRNHAEESDRPLIGPGFGSFLTQQSDDQQSFLTRTASMIIMEYDLASPPPGGHGPPGVFIVPGKPADIPAADSPDFDNQSPSRIHDEPAALIAALESAAGFARGAVDMGPVEQVWAALEGSETVTHAGVMPGRTTQAVRLIVQGVHSGNLDGILKRLRWEGDSSLAGSVLSALADLVKPSTCLSIDVTPQGVSPRIGMELYRPVDLHQMDRAGWKLLFDRLVEKGWCLPVKAGGMAEWPRTEILFGKDSVYKIRQTVNHVKMVIDGGTVRAKGYVAMDVLRT